MLVPGVLLLVGGGAAIYALSADRYLLPRLRQVRLTMPAAARHAHAH